VPLGHAWRREAALTLAVAAPQICGLRQGRTDHTSRQLLLTELTILLEFRTDYAAVVRLTTINRPGSAFRWYDPLVWRGQNVLCNPLLGTLIGLITRNLIRHGACIIDTSNHRIEASTKARLFFGFYEDYELAFVRKYLPEDLDVVELGSSLGIMSSHIAQRILPQRTLVCVEANPYLIPILHSNIRRNATNSNIRLLNVAVDYSGEAEVPLTINSNTAWSKVGFAGGRLTAEYVMVKAVTLTSILTSTSISKYALVCDIEGAEAGIVFADRTALEGCQHMIVELHDTEFQGRPVTVERLRMAVERNLGFTLVDRRSNAFYFARPTIR
jgi:FkbM family methyltransferase